MAKLYEKLKNRVGPIVLPFCWQTAASIFGLPSGLATPLPLLCRRLTALVESCLLAKMGTSRNTQPRKLKRPTGKKQKGLPGRRHSRSGKTKQTTKKGIFAFCQPQLSRHHFTILVDYGTKLAGK